MKLSDREVAVLAEFGIVLPPVTANVDKLKASKIDLTTAAGKELLAHAKIQDKLATGLAGYADRLEVRPVNVDRDRHPCLSDQLRVGHLDDHRSSFVSTCHA